MSLQVGQTAPDFTLVSGDKKKITRSEFEGQKNVLLLFYPGSFTSVCTTELNLVNNELDFYKDKEVEVLGVSTDSPFVQAEFGKVNALQFPLLSDHNATASEAFGAKYAEGEFVLGLSRVSRRAAFLINKEGEVKYAEVLENAGNMPNFEAIKSTIETL